MAEDELDVSIAWGDFSAPDLDHCTASKEHKNTGRVICDKKEKPGLDRSALDSNPLSGSHRL